MMRNDKKRFPQGADIPRPNHAGDKSFKRKLDPAKSKSLKITIIYFIVGCSWILFSDKLVGRVMVQPSNIELFSIIKGMIYVLLTSLLIYGLTYPALKTVMRAQETIHQINVDLENSNALYKGLYHEYEKKQSLLVALVNSIPDLIFYKGTTGIYLGCNKAFEHYAGRPESEIIGHTDIDLFPSELAQSHQKRDAEVLETNSPRISERIMMMPNGTEIVYETLKTPYYDFEGNLIGLIGIGRNISERKKKEEEIRYLNYHDVLTGLYNRAYFQEAQDRLDTPEYLPLSVIIGDVNGLKLINDAMGHAEGDKLLIEIANILKSCCRQDDVVARVGGDEYSILLPKTDAKTAWSVIERINAACAEYGVQPDKKVVYTNIALGYATKTKMSESLDKAMRSAEEFMYRRKLLEYKSFHNSILAAIKTAIREKNQETTGHEERMAALSKKLGRAAGLSEEEMVKLELVANLHDIGKISIDRNILNKREPLTEEEWRAIKKHPEIGFRIANASPELKQISDYILCHHERWDGTGYPQGLEKEKIPLISRMVSLIDAYDAMTQDLAYRKALSREAAIAEIIRNAGTQFDPSLVKTFIELMQEA